MSILNFINPVALQTIKQLQVYRVTASNLEHGLRSVLGFIDRSLNLLNESMSMQIVITHFICTALFIHSEELYY